MGVFTLALSEISIPLRVVSAEALTDTATVFISRPFAPSAATVITVSPQNVALKRPFLSVKCRILSFELLYSAQV